MNRKITRRDFLDGAAMAVGAAALASGSGVNPLLHGAEVAGGEIVERLEAANQLGPG